jgi:hypothetical protein
MAYGTVKVDNITFDNGGSDQNVTVSGLYRATTSGVTVSGTIVAATVSGVTIIGSTTVSGATVTGTTANFTSGNFSNIISSAATMSGALIMANQQQVRFREAVGNGVNHIALQAPAIVSADQTITLPDQTGTVVTTGDNGSVTSTMILDGTILNANINASAAIAGTKISPDFGSQTIVTTGVHSAAAGSATTPSIAFTGDLNTGIYSPGADQLALSTAGNGRLFIDGTGFVGIGTVPALGYALDVRGLARLLTVGGSSGLEIGNGTATNQSAYLDLIGDATYTDYGLRVLRDSTGANANSSIRHKGTGVLELITEEAGSITLATSNTERLRITSAGNVGIGTSSPGASLHVIGSTTVTSQANVAAKIGANTDSDVLIGSINGNAPFIASQGAYPLLFLTNATERARIDSSGRLLVGTSTSVVDTFGASSIQVSTTDGNAASFSRYSADSFTPIAYFRKSRGALNTQGLVSSGDTIGALIFTGSDGTGFIQGATIVAQVDGTPGANDMPGRLMFSTTADGSASPTERMRITSGGNVGIGTTSPGSRLEVNDTNCIVKSKGTAGYGSFYAEGSTGTPAYYFLGVNGTETARLLSDSSNYLAFCTGSSGTERLRIDSSGRLLVGTSSARSNFFNSTITANILLENDNAVLGVVRNGNNAFSSYLVLAKSRSGSNTIVQADDQLGTVNFQGNDGTEFVEAAQIAAFVDGTPGANDMPGRLVFSTTADGAASPAERMRITSGGNVGIGTTSPSFNLVSANSTTDGGWLYSSGSVSTLGLGGYSLAGDGAFQLKYDRSTGVITFNGGSRDTPVERVRIDSSGNVGIGTSSPSSSLEVAGQINAVAPFAGFAALQTAAGTGFRWVLNNDGTFFLQRTTDGFVTGSISINVDSSNRVGIGTTSPTTLLDVNTDTVRVRTARTPASASATGATGEICWDANYIYVCTATNTWKRSAISTW